MEKIVSLVRDYMRAEAEADAGYPLLRRIPSTRRKHKAQRGTRARVSSNSSRSAIRVHQ